MDELEAEARRRAVQGVRQPVFHQGKVVGHIRKYSDLLLIFLLKHRRPEIFADKAMVAVGAAAQAQQADLSNVPADRLKKMREWMTEARSR